MPEMICYCFAYSRNDIEKGDYQKGRSTIMGKIAREKRIGRCDCTEKNPSGT